MVHVRRRGYNNYALSCPPASRSRGSGLFEARSCESRVIVTMSPLVTLCVVAGGVFLQRFEICHETKSVKLSLQLEAFDYIQRDRERKKKLVRFKNIDEIDTIMVQVSSTFTDRPKQLSSFFFPYPDTSTQGKLKTVCMKPS
jgi:hypothetical protein